MADHITQYRTCYKITSGIASAYVLAYVRRVALDSGWFTERDSGGPSGGNWDDPDSIIKGDWYVLQSVANGWQVLFGIGGYQDPNDDTKGIIAGYDGTYIDPSNPYAYMLADYLGKWDTNADAPKTFDDGAPTASTDTPEFVQVDSYEAYGTSPFRGFFTTYHMVDPDGSGAILDGIILKTDASSNPWRQFAFIGYHRASDPIGSGVDENPYPFVYVSGNFDDYNVNVLTGYAPDAAMTGYRAAHIHLSRYYNRHWTMTRHGFWVELPLLVGVSDAILGVLPLITLVPWDGGSGSVDGKKIGVYATGWPW